MEDLDFMLEPDSHVYTMRGSVVPGCTSILTALARKPMDMIPKKILDHATAHGKAVHRAVELAVWDDIDRRTLQRRTRICLSRWDQWCEDNRVKPFLLPPKALRLYPWLGGKRLLVEVPMVHPIWRYGATPDLGLALVRDHLSTVEVKATSTNNDATALQTAAQEGLINYFLEPFGLKVEERYGVRLSDKIPKADVVRYKDKSDFATWLSFLNVSNWRSIHW